MTKRRPPADSSLVVDPDRPLIGVVLTEDGREVVHYFADEAGAHAAISPQDVADARTLAGVWADLDWDEVAEELDRIRHESEPTPPIDVL
jgi:hypothetical protein